MRTKENPLLRHYSNQLRSNMTDAEINLWYQLRNRRFCGIKFLRQKIIEGYIVDFVSLEIKLIIELDGSQHSEQHQYDEIRTQKLEMKGFKVIRFWNDEVLKNMNMVLDVIWQYQHDYAHSIK